MVRSISQTASGRARARLACSPASPQGQLSSIADVLPAGSAVPPEWHITSSPFSSPSSSPSPCPSSPESSASSYTSASSCYSSPATSRTPSPFPHKARSSCSRRSQKDPSHVSRPLNAFIIFRKNKCPEIRASGVERDNRIISRIVGGIWKKMSEDEKAPYRAEAQRLADEHKAEHPNYRFSPQSRAEPKKRRNVKRRDEVTRKRVAAIARAALEGASMKEAAEEFDAVNIQEPAVVGLVNDPFDPYTTGVFDAKAWVPPRPALELMIPAAGEETPFRSPLLPPSLLESLPDLANLSISLGDGSSPLSPVDLTVQPVQHAPTMHVVPLPDVPEADGLDLLYPSTPAYDYIPQPQVPAYAVHPSQPHGALALGDTYDAHIAPAFVPSHAQDPYSYSYGQVFSHDCQEYAAPAHQPAFVLGQHVPSSRVAAFQPELTLSFDHNYALPDHSLQVQPAAEVMYANTWPYVPSNDFQAYQPQEMATFASQMQGYVPVDGLNAWPAAYAHNGQMSVQQNWA